MHWIPPADSIAFVSCFIPIYYVDIVEVVGSSPIDPTKLRRELVAPLGTASKEAVFLFIWFFEKKKRALLARWRGGGARFFTSFSDLFREKAQIIKKTIKNRLLCPLKKLYPAYVFRGHQTIKKIIKNWRFSLPARRGVSSRLPSSRGHRRFPPFGCLRGPSGRQSQRLPSRFLWVAWRRLYGNHTRRSRQSPNAWRRLSKHSVQAYNDCFEKQFTRRFKHDIIICVRKEQQSY